MESPPTDLQPNDPIDGGKYKVIAKLGEGGMGVVYHAQHQFTLNEAAIKICIADNPDTQARFQREARGSGIVRDARFVTILDYGATHGGRPYIAMEFLRGQTLHDLMAGGGLTLTRALRILVQIAGALQIAHDRGIVHRDLKPENIFLLDGDVIKVLDLGIAKFTGGDDGIKTKTSTVMGTPLTMSPEQCRGSQVDYRSDIYSLGVMAYAMFAGRFPFNKEYYGELLVAHLSEPPPPLESFAPTLPAGLIALVHKTLAKDPAERPQSMSELEAGFAQFIDVKAAAHAATVVSFAPERLRTPTPSSFPASKSTVRGASGEISRNDSATAGGRTGLWVGLACVGLVAAVGGGYTLYHRGNAAATPTPVAPAPVVVAPAPAAPETFKVFVTTTPATASAAVDGKPLTGSSPYTLIGSPGKSLHLVLSAPGYKPHEEDVVVAQEDRRLTIPLESSAVVAAPAPAPTAPAHASSSSHQSGAKGSLSVFVLPFAAVSVDGKSIGSTPIRNFALKAGPHKVELSNPGLGKHETRTTTIEPGHAEKIQVDWSN